MNRLTSLFVANWELSLGVGAVALALGLLSRLLNRRYAARWKYWVWLVLAARLLLPFSLPLPKAPVRVETPPAALAPLLSNGAAVPGVAPAAGLPGPAAAAGGAGPFLTPLQFAAFLWAAGALLFLLYQGAGYLHFRRQMLRWGRPEEDPAVLHALARAQAALGMRSSVRVLRCPQAVSPLMFGFLSPVLVLPTAPFGGRELDFILAHELTHYKRHDLWYKLLLLCALALHWFNPLIHYMARQAGADLEISCDSAVVAGLDAEGRRAYSEAILSVLHKGPGRPSALSTYFWGGTGALKERFRNILNTAPKKRGAAAFACALLAIALSGGLVSCTRGKEGLSSSSLPSSAASAASEPGPGPVCQDLAFSDGRDGRSFLPFSLSLPLPEGWRAQPAGAAAAGSDPGYLLFDDTGEEVGQVTCFAFHWYPETDNYRAIYGGLMMGSLSSWDEDYTPVVEEKTFGTAICRPWQKTHLQDYPGAAAAAPVESRKGLLAYNADLLIYIAASLNEDALTWQEWELMARELRLSPQNELPPEVYPVEDALSELEDQLLKTRALGTDGMGLRDPRGLPLTWSQDQRFVTRLKGSRAFVAELDYAQDAGEESGRAYGYYALMLDGSGLYTHAGSSPPGEEEWTALF